jgi:hypothetical protein
MSQSLLDRLIEANILFRGLDPGWLSTVLPAESLKEQRFYSSRLIYTAFEPTSSLQFLYALVSGGPVVVRSSPLDRIIAITYPGSCFGMRSLSVAHGPTSRSFPSTVEAYKTTHVIAISQAAVEILYQSSDPFRHRYDSLFQLREKFQYHLLNCGSYPPQAIAALLKALVYQERELGSQPASAQGVYQFDLPIDIIARASLLNQRTVELVIKGLKQVGVLDATESEEDRVTVIDPEQLNEIYSTTRSKVDWWPLR